MFVEQSLCTYTHYLSCARYICYSLQIPLKVTQTCQSHLNVNNFFSKMIESECSHRGPHTCTCDSISKLITADLPLSYPATPVTQFLNFKEKICLYEGSQNVHNSYFYHASPSPYKSLTYQSSHNSHYSILLTISLAVSYRPLLFIQSHKSQGCNIEKN